MAPFFRRAPSQIAAPRIAKPRSRAANWPDIARAEIAVVEIIPATKDAPARPEWYKNAISWTGSEALPHLDHTRWEGSNESLAVRFEWALRRPTRITSQPETLVFEVDGRVMRHIPDFLIEADREIRIEVKSSAAFSYDPSLAVRLGAISQAYQSVGLDYQVATSDVLLIGHLPQNVHAVFLARRIDTSCSVDTVLEGLSLGERSFAELHQLLVPALGAYRARQHILGLHAQGRITIDLVAGPLGLGTTITGGRRKLPLPWRSFR